MAPVIVDKQDEKIIHLIRPDVQKARIGHVPPTRGLIKMDAMESPYSLPAYLRGEWLEEMQAITLNRYPDPEATELKAALRQVFDIPPGLELMLGNGSDELIQIINLALKGPGRKVMAAVPTFSMFQMIATYVGMDFIGVPLKEDDFSLDLPAMLAAIEQHQPAVIYLARPNNPTGNLYAEKEIVQLAEASHGLVVVDESYLEYSGVTMMEQLQQHDNLLIMRSLSKVGLAGLRLGYLVGHSKWVSHIERLRLPFNINELTQFTAHFMLGYYDVLLEQVEQIRRDRAWVAENIRRLKGVEVFPSETNFVLFRVSEGRGDAVDAKLKQKGILLKNLNDSSPLLKDCLRVTIGKPSENVAFLSALTSSI
jgi:histidinol-phosphate aminotransferase